MRDKITVGLFFGKKDHVLLWYFYHLVSSADFNFITKATIKHRLKKEHFKINIYTDLSSLLLEDLDSEIEDEPVQRNITFTKSDGFLYDWVCSLSKPLRASKIKQVLAVELIHCLNEMKNGDKEKEKEKDKETENKGIAQQQGQYPYPPIQPVYILQSPNQQIPYQQYQQMPFMQPNNQFSPQQQNGMDNNTSEIQGKSSKPSIQIDDENKKVLNKLGGNALSKMGRINAD